MSIGAGDLAIENLERLSGELRKDLSLIEQMIAELESDGVVKQWQNSRACLHSACAVGASGSPDRRFRRASRGIGGDL